MRQVGTAVGAKLPPTIKLHSSEHVIPSLPGTRNQSKLSKHAVMLVVGAIDGAMEDEGEVKTNGDILGLWELLEKRLDL